MRQVVAGGTWVLDGNYFDEISAEVWPAADAVIWLDLPRGRSVRHAVVRTVRRFVGRRVLWNGNRETVLNLAPASILRLLRRWPNYNARISALLEELPVGNVVLHLTSGEEIDAWLRGLGQQ